MLNRLYSGAVRGLKGGRGDDPRIAAVGDPSAIRRRRSSADHDLEMVISRPVRTCPYVFANLY